MTANSRDLTKFEISALPEGFTQAIDIASVKLINRTHNPFARNKIVCRGPKIFWPNHPKDFTRETLIIQSLLIHELCHVWQYETGRLSAARYLLDPRNWVYNYTVKDDAEFDDYPTEKQADLLQDWFLVNSGATPLRYDMKESEAPSKGWLNDVVPFDWNDASSLELV
jgi:hypothetical protein